MSISAQEMGQQAAGQAGDFAKKTGGKLARKAVGKAAKVIKKLVVNLIKKFILAAIKAVLAPVLGEAIVIILALLIFAAILMSIPFADWFLKGGERSPSEETSDQQYEQQFRDLADKSVEPIDKEEASDTWKETLKNIVKPNFAIPASLVRYQMSHSDEKVELPDPKVIFANLEPTFTYKDIKDDKEYTKSVSACYRLDPVVDDEGNKVKDAQGNQLTTRVDLPATETITPSTMKAKKIISKVETPFGTTEIPSALRYYPGGTYEPNNQWELSGSPTTSGNCTTTTYKRWEKTMVDDRGVPETGLDAEKFKAFLFSKGVKEQDLEEYFEYVKAYDPNFPLELYVGYGDDQATAVYGNADYTYTGQDVDGWVWPIAISYRGINSPMGPRWGRMHWGVDLGGRAWFGAPILAARDGVVVWSGARGEAGNAIIIAHDDGLQTRYLHMSVLIAKVGDHVTAGQQIGKEGSTGHSTGPHLHFEVAIPNPKDPLGPQSQATKVFDPMIFLGPIKAKGE